ncbi:MAG TPA: LysM peptidoglycan-binding domain-containing protein [Candidatus Hydrogenedentes bacterium]|nr:LysM peptidoglycan-binding domain-containing protein [Candidatus Hydrogenedentota bacterium]HPO29868.1 LysM peptidoglycan-binding domain-containing protein [Candidatus Hydrogenedentota bacterium]
MPMATAPRGDALASARKPFRSVPFHLTRGILLGAGLVILLHGCASTGRRTEQFKPAPREGIAHERELPGIPVPTAKPKRSYTPLEIPDPLPPEVLAEIDELRTRYPEVFQRGLNRGAPYEAAIRRMLREEGMPEDLVWLAMVESMFQNNAKSPASAVGMWQFIPNTARLYKLRVDRYVDERRDWRKATRAAIAYLQDLHDQFNGNWALAISGYNRGGTGMQRIVDAMGGETDFWKLVRTPPACDRMREETRKYYPRLLAYIIVTRHPEKYGFTRGNGSMPETEEIPVQGMYALADLERAMDLPTGTLEELNLELIAKVTPPVESWNLRIPKGYRERAIAALGAIRPRTVSDTGYVASHGYYTVKKGDTLSKIAARFNTTPEAIAQLNKFRKHNTLHVGQRLKIPGENVENRVTVAEMVEAVRTAEAAKDASARQKESPPPEPVYHAVAKGETLAAIARKYGTSVQQLIAWNGLNAKGTIYAGQRLKVGETSPESPPAQKKTAAAPGSEIHVVQKGETASAIAAQHGVSLDQLLAANQLKRDSVLRIGDRLKIPGTSRVAAAKASVAAETQPAASQKESATRETPGKGDLVYVVRKGDTLSRIAAAHGTTVAALRARNGMSEKDTLREGQKLVIPGAGTMVAGQGPQTSGATGDTPGRKIQHTVTAGQNPTVIARQYKVPLRDLFAWNGWDKPPVLKVGDPVTVYVRE